MEQSPTPSFTHKEIDSSDNETLNLESSDIGRFGHEADQSEINLEDENLEIDWSKVNLHGIDRDTFALKEEGRDYYIVFNNQPAIEVSFRIFQVFKALPPKAKRNLEYKIRRHPGGLGLWFVRNGADADFDPYKDIHLPKNWHLIGETGDLPNGVELEY